MGNGCGRCPRELHWARFALPVYGDDWPGLSRPSRFHFTIELTPNVSFDGRMIADVRY